MRKKINKEVATQKIDCALADEMMKEYVDHSCTNGHNRTHSDRQCTSIKLRVKAKKKLKPKMAIN